VNNKIIQCQISICKKNSYSIGRKRHFKLFDVLGTFINEAMKITAKKNLHNKNEKKEQILSFSYFSSSVNPKETY